VSLIAVNCSIGRTVAFDVFFVLPELLKPLATGETVNYWEFQSVSKSLCQSPAMPDADQVRTTRFRTQVVIVAPSIKRMPFIPIESF
jgi:hypothetical protein